MTMAAGSNHGGRWSSLKPQAPCLPDPSRRHPVSNRGRSAPEHEIPITGHGFPKTGGLAPPTSLRTPVHGSCITSLRGTQWVQATISSGHRGRRTCLLEKPVRAALVWSFSRIMASPGWRSSSCPSRHISAISSAIAACTGRSWRHAPAIGYSSPAPPRPEPPTRPQISPPQHPTGKTNRGRIPAGKIL